MKILALNGSLRGAKGVTHKILRSIGEGVKKAGGTYDIVSLSEYRIESCRACNHCQRSKTYKCILDQLDYAKHIFNRMIDADMLIYASPVYVFGISSVLKRFLERIHSHGPVNEILLTESGLFFHATDRSLSGKPFLSLVVCDNVENLTVRNTKEYFSIFGRFMDARHVAHLERRSAAAWMAALESDDKETKEYAAGVLSAYARAGEELATKGFVSSETRRTAERPFLKIPYLIRIARHISAFRPVIGNEVRKRSSNISGVIGC
jgi:multimeric flavodoxin WrbA